MKLRTDYISASTNRFPNVADIASNNTVFFGSSNLICAWQATDEGGITQALSGHEGDVTCIRVRSPTSLVSTDDRGMVLCWSKESENSTQWKSTKLQAHQKSICSLSVLDDCLVTGSSDSFVKIWKLPPGLGEPVEVQTILLSGRYPLSLSLALLPESQNLVLAIGQTDRNIHVWTRSEGNFVRAAVLTGHDDWVKSLAFTPFASGGVLVLASASQDASIRLWNFENYQKETRSTAPGSLSDELLDAFEESLGDFTDEEGGRQVSLKRHLLSVKSAQGSSVYSVTFDALLIGHEAGVTSVSWQPTYDQNSTPTLLSSSTDSSLILWSPSTVVTHTGDASTSLWINRQRFGDVGGQRLGGFVGSIWRKDGEEVMAWGWSGGWRRWRLAKGGGDVWEEIGAIGGHNGTVTDLDWSPNGAYLISAGQDQTTRIHGPVPQFEQQTSWHELFRPQVHGYDCLGVRFLTDLKFASISDEKVARIFEAPQQFVTLIEILKVSTFEGHAADRPMGASVPPLGLSNKVAEVSESPSSRRPFEGELASITLWPEVEKIFGHGYESSTIAVSNSKKYLATACKATSPEHAVIRLNDTSTWLAVGEPLSGHSLTVTRIAFSPDDQFVLTVSRDRSWRMFRQDSDKGYVPFLAETKAHGRIIWDCTWSREGDIFATASRDKTVKIWGETAPEKWTVLSTIKCAEAATAVDFTQDARGRHTAAIGLETGEIMILSSTDISTWKHEGTFKVHVAQITRLKWRTHSGSQLASCGEDGTLRVLTVQ
ncbi:WD40 repeat-like protein [Marasmius fiardii PR-910]|nr:WD40 repeat-like protein [Marasmius fiardii PR-910]